MNKIQEHPLTRQVAAGFAIVALLLVLLGGLFSFSGMPAGPLFWSIQGAIVLALGLLLMLYQQLRHYLPSPKAQVSQALLKTGALQDAIFNSANFSSIATDAHGVIQIFNVGAERMLGYMAASVIDKLTPANISDAGELIARAAALTAEFETPIRPGFEALVYKASRGIEDIYELTYIRADNTRFPALVSVTALRDVAGKVIGYLLIGTDNTARKQVEAEQIGRAHV